MSLLPYEHDLERAMSVGLRQAMIFARDAEIR